jgi:glycosyltransferase involved in cell wall biosynthesis
MCGSYDVTWDTPELVRLIEESGLRAQVRLLGRRDDMPRLTAAFDVATLSAAFGEGFPNTVGEAMSCGVPCVVTDVGDAARLVGNTGVVVPPRNPTRLAAALRKMLEIGHEGRQRLGMSARQRIIDNYSLPAIVSQYESLFYELAPLARSKSLAR